ncbi:hypothetical protein PVAG01_05589 [Phlyctema vagabunda]|uniref:NAD-dependent epimerase/dehydratase domain-containing protein n=1 Tax=Phlyctema vagabunda TaxID=108571 RepID=A0ABR4PKH7_9HELO
MAPRLFILGISGYVGGQFLVDITREHPDYHITGLVRNEEQARKINEHFPLTETVIGDLSSHEILQEEAQKADVVVQTANCDVIECVEPLISGMAESQRRGAYIQISGAGSIIDTSTGFGQASTRIWDDITDFDEIHKFDATHLHSVVDQAVQALGNKYGIKTALLLPASINGVGDGPIKSHSIQLPQLRDTIAKRGRAFVVGDGKAIMASVDVKDVSTAIQALVGEALQPEGGKATWGDQGIYYLESEEYSLLDITTVLAKAMHDRGLIQTAEVDHISSDEAQILHSWGPMIFGSNMRCKGSRIRQTLGWKPKQSPVFDIVRNLQV